MQWSLGLLSLLCSTSRSTKLAHLCKLDWVRFKWYIGMGMDKVDIFLLLVQCFQLDVSYHVYNCAGGSMWLVPFQRNIDSKCWLKAVHLAEFSFNVWKGLVVIILPSQFYLLWGLVLGNPKYAFCWDPWKVGNEHQARCMCKIWGCFAERPSRHAIATLQPNIEGTDSFQRSTAASRAKILFITTNLTKARLQKRKEMLASDGCKFLSPNQFRTLIVKNQQNICSHYIGTFPQGHKGRELSFMKCISISYFTNVTTAPRFDNGALRVLRNFGWRRRTMCAGSTSQVGAPKSRSSKWPAAECAISQWTDIDSWLRNVCLQKCHFQTDIKCHRWSSTEFNAFSAFPMAKPRKDQKCNSGIRQAHFVSHIGAQTHVAPWANGF